MTIWKYPLEIKPGRQHVDMPANAEILTAQMQGGAFCLWALVDPSAPSQRRMIAIFGAGHPVPDARRRYIGTTQQSGLAWHVFELLAEN